MPQAPIILSGPVINAHIPYQYIHSQCSRQFYNNLVCVLLSFSAALIKFLYEFVLAFENDGHATVCVETTSLLGDDIDITFMTVPWPTINITGSYTIATGK